MGKAKFANGTPVVAVAIGGDELEAPSIREILGLARANGFVPDSLKSKRSGRAKVSVTPNMDRLNSLPAFNALIIIKLDRLQLQVDEEATQRRVQFWVPLD